MKKCKKLFAVCVATVLMMASTITVFAAPSATTSTTVTDVSDVSAKAADGTAVAVAPVSTSVVASAQSVAVSMLGTGANVMAAFDLTAAISGPTDITLSVPGISAGSKLAVLHQKADGTWESVPVKKVENGSVTATFTSLSPVAIVTYTDSPSTGAGEVSSAATVSAGTSPKTGEAFPVAGMICMTALLGAAVCFKKYAR